MEIKYSKLTLEQRAEIWKARIETLSDKLNYEMNRNYYNYCIDRYNRILALIYIEQKQKRGR